MSKETQSNILRPLVESGRYSWTQIARSVNSLLGKSLPPSYFENWAHRNKIKNHYYGDGHENLRFNTAKPVGHRMKDNGYTVIKCSDGKYRYEHRVVWEQHHGKIPEGMIVVFMDGDSSNMGVENLEVITRGEAGSLAHQGKRLPVAELNRANLLRVRINQLVKKKEKDE